ncbi:MAG TPA: TonB-dependent receptor [Casimicrobium sp.]|nr:TonB-dependent receptor [Casimicrobium sp.]
MYTVKSPSLPRVKHLARAVSLALASAAISGAFAQTPAADDKDSPRAKDDAVRLGTITIVGQGDKLGAGQILKEDAVKARSTVTKEATEKDQATSNPFQAISLLPSVNTYSYDATGLFGGGISIRGFGADQIGFTINGVPVNDSGNYAVFPQEYIDQENSCTQSVAQGTPEVESPHIGATGGSVSIVMCDPENKRRFRASQTLGGLSLSRTFLRVDSGRFANDKAKVFLSYSHSQADKWKGPGEAKRDHIDAAFSYDITPEHRILGSVMYNKAINNNIYSMSLAQLGANGYDWDHLDTFTPGHLTPVKGTAQLETTPAASRAFYKLSANPFENMIASVSGSFKLAENTYLKVQPYLWYGYGTGGNQQKTLSETGFLNTTTGKLGAGVDLNGDGDTLDRIIIANSNVTRTMRPGATAELSHTLGAHQLKLGFWFERAEHRQFGPAVGVDADGNPSDIWLRDGRILRPDGSPYQSRDWLTVSPSYQVYAADSFSFMNDRGLLSVGVRAPSITRKFTNFPSEASGSQFGYSLERKFSAVLPQIGVRFYLDREQQVFANTGKNFRAPPNFVFAPGTNVTVAATNAPQVVGNVQAETSVNTDVGYRFQGKTITFSATAFNTDFKDRQANAYDPNLNRSFYANAGSVRNRGLELEVGTAPINGITAYASLTAQKSRILNDLAVSAGKVLPTYGKQFPLTPQMLAGLSVQYSNGPFYARIKAKKTGRQYATIMNDEEVPSYTTADFAAGYTFADMNFIKSPKLKLNVSNIGNTKYRTPSSGSVVNAQAVGTIASSGTVFYYLGAPRSFSVSLSADF